MKLTMLQIRVIREEDLKHIYLIEERCFGKEAYPRPLLFWLYHLHRDEFFVAEVKGKVVGYAVGAVMKGRGHIISIAVDPEHQRKGIGTRLLTALMEQLEKRKVKGFRLEVKVDNEAARRFYEKHGFKQVGFVEGYYRDGTGAVIYEKSSKPKSSPA
ncbi:MAG: ribosomal-protein-alanine N-acetyltransferase [Thermoprotei archaeon]|nr:MAG: ribosomal-protein-alanine N-acetyltransferase [Thermoprotei archaeon]